MESMIKDIFALILLINKANEPEIFFCNKQISLIVVLYLVII